MIFTLITRSFRHSSGPFDPPPNSKNSCRLDIELKKIISETKLIFIYFFPFQRGKRISKVRVLQRAIDYIKNLHDMVLDHDGITNVNHNYYHSDTDSSLFAF